LRHSAATNMFAAFPRLDALLRDPTWCDAAVFAAKSENAPVLFPTPAIDFLYVWVPSRWWPRFFLY